MAFVSFAFIGFMAIVAALYFVFPQKARWIVLLIASYVFFWVNSEWLILALFAQTLGTFLFGLWIQRIEDRDAPELAKLMAEKNREAAKNLKIATRARKRRVLIAGIIFNLGALGSLKYFDFFSENANALLSLIGIQIPHLGILVPIGLSFYSLQAISYLIDLRRNKMEADRNLFHFMLFMSYFPQIVQGPIPRYHQLAHQLYEGHSFDYQRLCYGAQLILWGFMKKLVLADRIAIPVNQLFDNWTSYDGLILFIAAAGYGLQVYADFSGGIDIARGFSQVLGIELEQNFRQPYFSKSVTEFWRRWHITLGAWMRDYVFYPLSMSKVLTGFGKIAGKVVGSKTGRRLAPCIATFLVFFCVGLWHGPRWTYVGYGIWNGIFLSLATVLPEFYAFLKRKLHINDESKPWHVFQMFRTFIIAAISRFFPRATTLSQALGMFSSMLLGWNNISFITDGTLLNIGLDVANWVIVIAMIVIMFVVGVIHERNISIREVLSRQILIVRWTVYLAAILIVLVFGVYGTEYDAAAFIYQQF